MCRQGHLSYSKLLNTKWFLNRFTKCDFALRKRRAQGLQSSQWHCSITQGWVSSRNGKILLIGKMLHIARGKCCWILEKCGWPKYWNQGGLIHLWYLCSKRHFLSTVSSGSCFEERKNETPSPFSGARWHSG